MFLFPYSFIAIIIIFFEIHLACKLHVEPKWMVLYEMEL